MRVEQDPVGAAAEAMEGFEYHDCVAEVGGVGGILAVGEAGPVDVLMDEGGGVGRGMLRENMYVGGLPYVEGGEG